MAPAYDTSFVATIAERSQASIAAAESSNQGARSQKTSHGYAAVLYRANDERVVLQSEHYWDTRLEAMEDLLGVVEREANGRFKELMATSQAHPGRRQEVPRPHRLPRPRVHTGYVYRPTAMWGGGYPSGLGLSADE